MRKAGTSTKEGGATAVEMSASQRRKAWVLRRAAATFGDLERAAAWMRRANRALGGRSPEAVLTRKGGVMLVLNELGRIEYGELY